MRVGALTSLLEPVMIVAMGGGVAFHRVLDPDADHAAQHVVAEIAVRRVCL